MMIKTTKGLLIASLLGGATAASTAEDSDTLSINWYHEQEYFQPVIDAFTAKTGIPVKVTSDYDTFTTDVAMVSDYKGLLEARNFMHFRKFDKDFWKEMSANVPAKWRDAEGYWLGYAVRTRTALTNKQTVSAEDKPKSYMDLADPKWKGRMTQRVSSNVYNRSMVAYMIARYGEDKALEWAKGIAANVPGDGYHNDVVGAMGVAKGTYDIGFSNTYYLGYVRKSWYPDDAERIALLDKSLDVTWLDGGHGVFGNITGVAITAWVDGGTEKHRQAQELVRFLLSKEGQELMSQHVHKYPVNVEAEPSEYLKSKGTFKMDDFDVNELRYHYDKADQIMKEAGWKSHWW